MVESKARAADMHCHLDLFDGFDDAITRFETKRVLTLTMTTTPRAYPRNRKATGRTRFIVPALGMHPQIIESEADKLPLFEALLPTTRFVGEVGLDGSAAHRSTWDLQVKVFNRILDLCAREGGRTLSVHSRNAAGSVVSSLAGSEVNRRNTVLLHWFTGSLDVAERALQLGCHFSINPRMSRTKAGRRLIERLPEDRLLPETDAPFSSSDHRSDPVKSFDDLCRDISSIRQISVDGAREILLRNARNLLR